MCYLITDILTLPGERVINNVYPAKTTRHVLSPSTKSPLCIQGLCQADIDNMSEHLKLYFDVLSPCRAQITLFNGGSNPIRNGKWAIHICVLGIIQEQQLTNNPEGYVLPGGHLKMTHISGCLYKLEPLSHFQSLASGDVIKVQFNTTLFRARCNLTPNWYIASEGLEPQSQLTQLARTSVSCFPMTSSPGTSSVLRMSMISDMRHIWLSLLQRNSLSLTKRIRCPWDKSGGFMEIKGWKMKLTSWQVCETFVYPRFPLKGVCKNLLKLKTINYKFSCVYVNVGITEKKNSVSLSEAIKYFSGRSFPQRNELRSKIIYESIWQRITF